MADDHHRTVVTRLDISGEARRLLERTIDEWRRGCQLAVDMAWTECQQPGDVQSLAYDSIREETALKSQHAILATRRAAEAIKSCLAQSPEENAVSKPDFTAPTVTYDQRTMTVFDDGSVSLATVEHRIRPDLALPADDDGYQHQFLDDEIWRLGESTLTARDGAYFLHLGFRRPASAVEPSTAENGTVLGVDLGVRNIAVTSTASFFSGGELEHRLRAFERTRRGLRQTGTQSARRTLKSRAGRQQRYVRDRMHCISRAIVEEAIRYDCSIIAIEDLSGIQPRLRDQHWLHRWAFRQLRAYIEYKARDRGITVEAVDPEHTSRRCADCGHVAASNRPSTPRFACDRCGNQADADYNAAKNIALRCVRRDRQSSRGTGARRCALKSGTVTPNGGFTAYPNGFQAESADKSPP